jgi:hypothetical protein
VPSFARPPASPRLPAPARVPKEVCLSQGGVQRSMLLRRRALRCIGIRIILIVFWLLLGVRSLFYVFVLYYHIVSIVLSKVRLT